MKAEKFRTKLQKDLRNNYEILQQILIREELASFKYEERLYIILEGSVKMPAIFYYIKKIYTDQKPQVCVDNFVRDAKSIKYQIVSKAWRFKKTFNKSNSIESGDNQGEKGIVSLHSESVENKNQKIQTKPQKQEIDHKKSPDTQKQRKEELQTDKRKRISTQQMLNEIQRKLNAAKSEIDAAKHQKQYNKYFKQLTFLRNKKRVLKQEKIMEKIVAQNPEGVSKRVLQVIALMSQTKHQQGKILDKLPKYQQKMSKTEEVSRVNSIFVFYAKKQTKQTNRYFSDLQKDQDKLQLETFLKFVNQWGINRIVSVDEISHMFKGRSKGKNFIKALQFSELLSDIHSLECIKEGKPINNQSFSQYMQEYILVESKINRFLLNTRESSSLIGIKDYKYEKRSHSGKYANDIEEDLQNRKKTLNFLAGPKNNPEYNLLKKTKSRQATLENSRVDEDDGTTNQSLYYPDLRDSLNSYAFRFQFLNAKKRVKTEGIKAINQVEDRLQKVFPPKSVNSSICVEENGLQNNFNRDEKLNMDEVFRKKVPFEGFEDLIEEQEEDEFLRKHLLPPLQNKRISNRIHF